MAEGSRGFTFVELLVTLLLTALLVGLTLRAFAVVGLASRQVTRRGSEVTAMRAARVILRSELRGGVPRVDWHAFPPDSVRLRAFRAVATACGLPTDSSLVVSRRVGRRPDPGKDSVLVLDAEGEWEGVALVSWSPGALCPDSSGSRAPASLTEAWVLSPIPDQPTLLLLFEAASYHLANDALRYRRGRGGRQPLTEEVLPSARLLDSLGVLRVVLPLGQDTGFVVDIAGSGAFR